MQGVLGLVRCPSSLAFFVSRSQEKPLRKYYSPQRPRPPNSSLFAHIFCGNLPSCKAFHFVNMLRVRCEFALTTIINSSQIRFYGRSSVFNSWAFLRPRAPPARQPFPPVTTSSPARRRDPLSRVYVKYRQTMMDPWDTCWPGSGTALRFLAEKGDVMYFFFT